MIMESGRYEETRQALYNCPVLRGMVDGLAGVPLEDIMYDDGEPKGTFMMAALREYNARGGQVPTHIGGPAEALIRILRERRGA